MAHSEVLATAKRELTGLGGRFIDVLDNKTPHFCDVFYRIIRKRQNVRLA